MIQEFIDRTQSNKRKSYGTAVVNIRRYDQQFHCVIGGLNIIVGVLSFGIGHPVNLLYF